MLHLVYEGYNDNANVPNKSSRAFLIAAEFLQVKKLFNTNENECLILLYCLLWIRDTASLESGKSEIK